MAMLVALTLAFPSCNVEMELGNNTLEYRERTAYLCSYDWQDDWYDDYGLHHFQVLRFYTNGTGEDFIRIQDARGRWEEYTYTFTWDWYDAFYTSIRLNYGRWSICRNRRICQYHSKNANRCILSEL